MQSGLDSNLNGDSAGDRSIVNPAGQANVGTGVTGYDASGNVATSSGSIVAYVANNSNARYVTAGSGALADSGRNTFPLHRIDNIDMSLKKRLVSASATRSMLARKCTTSSITRSLPAARTTTLG